MRSISVLSAVVAIALPGLGYALPANADTAPNVKLFGRLLYDYTLAEADTAAFEVDETELRTARLGLAASQGNIALKIELETDQDGEVSVTDAYIDLTPDRSSWTIRLGQFKTPNSLEEQTSGRFTAFTERAAFTDAFGFDRRVGISASTGGEAWTFTAGAFGGDLNDTPSQEGYALAARGTYTPVHSGTMLVHLGTSVRYRENGEGERGLRYRQRPFAHIPGSMVSTGPISSADTFIGLEGAILRGPLWLSSEYGTLSTNLTSGAQATFDGSSIEVGYIFGGARTYKDGKFERPRVEKQVIEGGYGALAISAAYNTLDLTDSGIDGGSMDTALLGLSWYPTSKTRVTLNLFQSEGDLGISTSGLAPAFADAVRAGIAHDRVTGVTLRLQADF